VPGTVLPSEAGSVDGADLLTVTGMEAKRIGELAASASVVLYELTPQLASLEEAFMELTSQSLEFGMHGALSDSVPAAGDNTALGAEREIAK
jgi:ABC-2 type transport system ATP-binding protein